MVLTQLGINAVVNISNTSGCGAIPTRCHVGKGIVGRFACRIRCGTLTGWENERVVSSLCQSLSRLHSPRLLVIFLRFMHVRVGLHFTFPSIGQGCSPLIPSALCETNCRFRHFNGSWARVISKIVNSLNAIAVGEDVGSSWTHNSRSLNHQASS